MPQPNDLSRSLTALDENSTLIAVIEMSQKSWLVAGIVPGVERRPRKKLEPDERGLLRLLHRWREEAEKAGRTIDRIAVAPCSSQGQAFEAGRDGFWLARWLQGQGIEAGACPGAGPRGCTHLGAPDWLLLTGGFPTRAGVCCRARHLGIREAHYREAHYGEYRPGGDGVVGWLVRGSPPR